MKTKNVRPAQALWDDAELISLAGPAVLRLKLLEVAQVLEKRSLPDDIRATAERAAQELRVLIAERPCVSLVDRVARAKVLGLPLEA
jgi:hypothetical protein